MPAFRLNNIFKILITTLAVLAITAGMAFASTNIWPSIGASTVDFLRGIIGGKAVAKVEDLVLNTEDIARQPIAKAIGNSSNTQWQKIAPTPIQNNAAPQLQPPTASAIGQLYDEAKWQPFINSNGRTVAFQTNIFPDQDRAYAYAAVIAFDLQHTRLHFVLGTLEPKSEVDVPRPGQIPIEDRQPDVLLAAFNGGFKAEHGQYGVMVDGVTILPPRSAMGTVGLYADGSVKMGLMDKDVPELPEMLAWRQNGPLVIQNGVINSLTSTSDAQVWGYVVGNDTATDRSALGISQDGHWLYYVVGESLTLPTLAKTLAAVQAYQAIQLDINNYWAHFESFSSVDGQLIATPLLDFMKGSSEQRFLGKYERDFFYVTAK